MIVRLTACAALVSLAVQSPLCAASNGTHQFSGVASYYDTHYHGRTASGANYNPNLYTAAHRSLAFGTRLRVTEPRSGHSVEVVVNDRGPFNRGRVLDLSLAAARQLQMIKRGLTRVTASIVAP
ncbi:MAG TPA: septal ring lytic transglycosylase RlpA family protein [Rhodanobacteraceae bacterium]|jgi:peptidoglycan lytic transglycosylase|nr:septal ring lytic transglycosylase RlpA family protein [Rhodanobacteraceae bacterium]